MQSSDSNLACDIYVRDLEKGVTTRVSVASDGAEAKVGGQGDILPESTEPSLSADGRYIAFQSAASNLVEHDTNAVEDVFVHDRLSGKTRRVSVASDGTQASAANCLFCSNLSIDPDVNASGRFVTFSSRAGNLVEDDDNDTASDVFVHDLKKRKTIRVSIPYPGAPKEPAGDIVGEVNGLPICENAGGVGPVGCGGSSHNPSLSKSGRHVVFMSFANNLVRNDTNVVRSDVFVRDLKKKKTVRVSVASDGTQVSADVWTDSTGGRQISDDGRYAVFVSSAGNLIPADGNSHVCNAAHVRESTEDVFVHDLKTRRTERVSIHSNGEEAEWGGGHIPHLLCSGGLEVGPSISGNGRVVSFSSNTRFTPHDVKGNLLCGGPGDIDCNEAQSDPDVFAYDRKTGELHWVSQAHDGSEGMAPSERTCSDYYSDDSTVSMSSGLSRNGRYLVYLSCAVNLVQHDVNEMYDFFVRDMGPEFGVGGLDGEPPASPPRPDGAICVQDVCVPPVCVDGQCLPPSGVAAKGDPSSDVRVGDMAAGSDLIGARLAYRPRLRDLYLTIELDHLPSTFSLGEAESSLSLSPLQMYGARFEAEGHTFEIRATSAASGSQFGLFDCSGGGPHECSHIAKLRGGIGTTGERVVVSVPLETIGLAGGGRLVKVRVFTAIGTQQTGAVATLDQIHLRK